MTAFSGANDGSNFDGNTILLECGDKEDYVYFSGLEFSKIKTDDKIIDYISLMGKNMCPYATMVREKNTYFISYLYKIVENAKIEEGTLLNAANNNLDPFVYHHAKCGKDSFKKLERNKIHSCWSHDVEDEIVDLVVEDEDDVLVEEDEDLIETNFCNGNNEVDKSFNQKCVICIERDSVYAFRQCGHQCICEQFYQNKDDINMLKCVVCRI